MSIVIDVETTGFPSRHKPVHIVSISWVILDAKTYEELHKEYYVVNGDFEIPSHATYIHGLTNEYCKKHGVSLKDYVIPKLKETMLTYQPSVLVAHNLLFDKAVLLEELQRLRESRLVVQIKRLNEFCTMSQAKKRLQLMKMPKLADIYARLTGRSFSSRKAHNALYDALHCGEVYKYLLTQH